MTLTLDQEITQLESDIREGSLSAASYLPVAMGLLRRVRAQSTAAQAALKRLGSMEAFSISQVVDGPLADEFKMRVDFAREQLAALSPTPAAGGEGS